MLVNVRFGSLADMRRVGRHVRFVPKADLRMNSSARAQDKSAVGPLGWARIHCIEFSEGRDIRIGHLYRIGEKQPVDDLVAWRRRQRPGIPVIGALGWQQSTRIDCRIGLDRRSFLRWHRRDNLVEYRVGLACWHQYTDHCETAARVAMDEVHLHRKALAADQMLARPVEVKLQQRELVLANRKRAAFGDVDQNGVAVIDDRVGLFAPRDGERRELGLDGFADVDRRLLTTDRTYPAGSVEISPLVGADGALVTPMYPFGS